MNRYICQQDFDETTEANKIEPEEAEEITIDELTSRYNALVEKFNDVVKKLKGTGTAVLAALFSLASMGGFSADPPGKARFGSIRSNQYVVTQEVDNVFQEWSRTNNYLKVETDVVMSNKLYATDSVEIGRGSNSSRVPERFEPGSEKAEADKGDTFSVAIGPAYNPSPTWTGTFTGGTEAYHRSVAIGDAAKALQNVSVAIGNQAHVGEMHGTNNQWIVVDNIHERVIAQTWQNGILVSTTTNDVQAPVEKRTFNVGKYERVPVGTGSFPTISYVETITNKVEPLNITIVEHRDEQTSSIVDVTYVEPDEYAMYDRWFDPGQGMMNFLWATYGVAIGSRTKISGYHSVAFGHYAEATRPQTAAIGPGSHIYSEGGVGLGYDNDIDKESPFSLAIGSVNQVPSGMTNAIVIGVPPVDASSYERRNSSEKGNQYTSGASPLLYSENVRPKAMKSNSINFVFHGEGLKDVFVDNVPLTDRMAGEIAVLGSQTTKGGITSKNSQDMLKKMLNLPENDDSLVLFSGNGKIRLYTQNYIDDEAMEGGTMDEFTGDVTQVEINGKNLSEIMQALPETKLSAYKDKVNQQADAALNSLSNANSISDMKNLLRNFFEGIKSNE